MKYLRWSPSLRSSPFLVLAIWVLGTLFLWGLAFYPMGSQSPEWLTVARNVCFGVLDNGLPDVSGWIILILGPISFLIVASVTWKEELKDALQNIWFSKKGRVILVILLMTFAVEAHWVKDRLELASQYEKFNYTNPSEEDLAINYPRAKMSSPDFTLIDQSGKNFRLKDLKGETVLLTFAFAHCQTVCPTLVRQALDIGNEFNDKRLRVAIITLDPWRDTPKSLPFLAEKWKVKENAHILSGSVKDVTSVLDQFKMAYKRDERTGDVVHPSLVYLIAPDGEIAYIFNDAPSRWLRQAIERIANDRNITTTSR